MSVILRFDAVIGLNQQHVQGVEETDSKNTSYGRCVGGKQMLQVRSIYDRYTYHVYIVFETKSW